MLAFKRCFSLLTKPLTYQAVGISDNKTFVSFTVLWSGVYLTIMELTPNKIVVYFNLHVLHNNNEWNVTIYVEYLSTFA